MIDIVSLRTEGLGDSTYLVLYEERAIVIDPQRDIDRFLDRLGDHQPRWVLETHLHNDYVSGGLSLARRTGAELVMPAAAAPAFRHTPAFHHEDLVDGDVTIRPLHTPGHTPEHTSYVVIVEGKERAVFSGGSLLVGSAGRSDLLGPDRADSLARLQYRSVSRLARLPEGTGLYPTHGAGSFCTSSSAAGDSTSTIGDEKRTNPVLSHPDEDAFVASQLSGLEPYPDYYARMGPINLAGPPALGDVSPPRLTADDLEGDTPVVDTRSADDFAAGHLPGALNIPLSDQFGTWLAWLLDADIRPVLVTADSAATTEAVVQLARLGIDGLPGVIEDARAGSVQSRTARISDLSPDHQILDVRSPVERSQTAPAGTVHRYLPDLRQGPPAGLDPDSPVWVMCATGFRSAIAASMLQAQGIEAIPVLDGGVDDL